MTDDELAATRARRAAIIGPWALADGARGFIPGLTVFEAGTGRVVHEAPILGALRQEQYKDDCAFIAAAPGDIDTLLVHIATLETANRELRETIVNELVARMHQVWRMQEIEALLRQVLPPVQPEGK